MARVTVEDCTKIIPNRFKLSVLASYRAKEISKGSPIKIDKSDDKTPVIALREISTHKHDIESLNKSYINSLQQNAYSDDVLEEETHNISNEFENQNQQSDTEKSEKQNAAEDNVESEFISVDDYSFEDEDDSELGSE